MDLKTKLVINLVDRSMGSIDNLRLPGLKLNIYIYIFKQVFKHSKAKYRSHFDRYRTAHEMV